MTLTETNTTTKKCKMTFYSSQISDITIKSFRINLAKEKKSFFPQRGGKFLLPEDYLRNGGNGDGRSEMTLDQKLVIYSDNMKKNFLCEKMPRLYFEG